MNTLFSNRIWSPMGAGFVRGLFALVGLAAVLTLTGCSSYSLQGMVIEGKTAQVLVVDKNDPRLGAPGLRDSRIDVTIDPRALRPNKQPTMMTADDGRFSLPINESGAGFLEYDAALVVQREGFMHIEQTIRLPSSGKRVLIIMRPGNDSYKPETNIVDETVREGQRIDMLPRN